MLSDEQKQAIEYSAILQVRQSWRGLMASRVRGVMDDIRAKVVEEPWFGRATTSSLNAPSEIGYRADTASVSDIYGWVADQAQSAWASVYGRDAAREIGSEERPPPEHEADGPDAGR